MRDNFPTSPQDRDFEALLAGSLPELPPGDVVDQVTPWKTAMHRVLLGMALCAITLRFGCLDTILPTAGMLLSLLGFRSLRRENFWFQSCWGFFCCRAVLFFPQVVWDATLFPSTPLGSTVASLCGLASALLLLLMVFCLWRGLVEVQRRVNRKPHAGAAGALVVWYALVCLLGFFPDLGLLTGIPLLVAYLAILCGLYRLSARLEEAGYAIHPLPLRVSDRALAGGILLALGLGLGCAYLFGGTYSMDWQPRDPQEQTQEAAIRAHLAQLGFPQDLLADLSGEDISDCGQATQVAFVTRDRPVNRGRQVTTQTENGSVTDVVYDRKELRFTGVCVRLSEEEGTWRLFQFFQWVEEPGYWGTEAIRLSPAYGPRWNDETPVTGRVLYDRDGVTYTAPYYALDDRVYTQDDLFFGGQQTTSALFAAFSLPKEGEHKRGYLTYSIQPVYPEVATMVDSAFDYTHQCARWQYPVQSAAEHAMTGGWNLGSTFFTVQSSLQFYSHEGQPW